MSGFPRRTLLIAFCATMAARAAEGAEPAPVVTLFGDSIAAGYGLAPADGLTSRLQAALSELGITAEVRNAGVPGETSAGGLGRLDAAVRKDTAVCVVEFGGNDRRLGFPASLTRDSLDAIVKRLKARGVAVVLIGQGAGERDAVYRQVAEGNRVLFYPDLFAGVARGLRQADGVHPNAAGADLIAKGLAPLVAEALRARGRP